MGIGIGTFLKCDNSFIKNSETEKTEHLIEL
jgi:hypothetical protein